MTAPQYITYRGLRFVVTVSRDAAAYLTNPAESLPERGGYLHELLASQHAHAGASKARRGHVAVAILVVVHSQLATAVLAATPRYRRGMLAAVTGSDHTLFCGASLAETDAPAAAYHGVPLTAIYAAEAALRYLDTARVGGTGVPHLAASA